MIIIEDERVEAHLHRLVALTGQPIEEFVGEAARARLAELWAKRAAELRAESSLPAPQFGPPLPLTEEEIENRLAFLRQISDEGRRIARELGITSDHSDLYDEDGLPC